MPKELLDKAEMCHKLKDAKDSAIKFANETGGDAVVLQHAGLAKSTRKTEWVRAGGYNE